MKRKSIVGSAYPKDWGQIALKVKEDAGWKCVRCGKFHAPQEGYTLTVHHFDLDPSNCRWWNLGALCQRCHLHIQGKVVMYQPYMFEHSEWFKPYVAGYYAYTHGLPDDREYVESHLEELLEYGKPHA